METKKITIEVEAGAASAYESTSPEKRRKIDTLLSLQLNEAVHEETASLKDIMREMSREARQRGLTPETLQSILNEEE